MFTQTHSTHSQPVTTSRPADKSPSPFSRGRIQSTSTPRYQSRPNDMRGPMDWHRYWMDRTVRELSQRNFTSSTRDMYLAAMKDFLHHHPCAPSSLRPDAIGRYLLRCKEERGLNPSSVDLILASLVFFYQHVVKAPYCISGIPRMKEDKKPPNVLGPGSMKALIDGTANEKHRLALSLAYGCGLRVSELARMKWTDLDFQRGVLHIRKSKGSKDRVVMIPDSLIETIKAYRERQQPITYIFESTMAGKPLCTRTFQAVFEKACGKTGFKRKGGNHSQRHSVATHLPGSCTDLRFIQALLGDSGSKTTQRYTHVTAADITRVASPSCAVR